MTLFFAEKPGSFSSPVYQSLQEEKIAYTVAESVPIIIICFSSEVNSLTLAVQLR